MADVQGSSPVQPAGIQPAQAVSGLRSLPRLLAWIGIFAAVVFLTFGGGGGALGVLVQWRIADLAFVVVALVAWLAVAVVRPEWWPRTALWPAFAASLGAIALSTLTSWNPRLSVEIAAYAVICTAMYLLLVRLLADPWFRARLGGLAVLLCLTIGVYYVAVVVNDWIHWWAAIGRITVPPLRPNFEGLTYGNPSAVASMMLLLCAASVAYLGVSTRPRRLLVSICVALTAATLVLSGSRGALLGCGSAAGAIVVALALLPSSRASLIALLRRRAVRIGLAGAAMVAVLVGIALAPALLDRLLQSDNGYRLTFYLAAIEMFASSPIVGSGPGTWVARRVAFTNGTTGMDLYIPHAHDIYLQTAAELGLVGLAAGVVVAGLLARLIWRALRDSDDTRRRYGWASLFAVAYLAGHQVVDVYAGTPVVLFALALTVAHVDATTDAPLLRFRIPAAAAMRRAGTLALGLAVAGAVLFSAWSESIAAVSSSSAIAMDNGHPAQALADARLAAAQDPQMPPYQFTLGLAAAASGDLQTAEQAFVREAGEDDFPEGWLDLAAVRMRLGDKAGATLALDQAMRLGWQQPVVDVPAATLYLSLGNRPEATQAIAHAFAIAPELAADPFWSSTAALKSAAAAAVDQAVVLAGPDPGYRILMAAGRTTDALRLAATLGAASNAARWYVQSWNGDQAALTRLTDLAVASPLTGPVVLGEFAAERLGAEDVAMRLARIASQGAHVSAPVRALIAVEPTCGACVQMPGANAQYYGFFTYRRRVPADLLVLDLPRLAYR